MNIIDLQAKLRHFAAERDWQHFHTPKNLATALMVEAAELAEIFQWMTPEESCEAHIDPFMRHRIGEEIADVFLYLIQVADHTQTDLAQAITDKLVRNVQKYPPKRVVASPPASEAKTPDTHILLDYENVQPTEAELRAMVPEATKVWVFHGPHQKHVEERFTSFGEGMTAILISKTGKNALDFHLSFYMGYIASRNEHAKIVVVANDKGYEPMLEHAKALGFAVRQHGHARTAQRVAEKDAPAKPAAPEQIPTIKKTAEKKTPTKAPTAKKAVAKKAPTKKLAAKKAKPPVTKSPVKAGAAKAVKPAPTAPSPKSGSGLAASPSMLQKMADGLRKMGNKRPAKQASLRRAIKSLLGNATSEDSVDVALKNLIARSVVAVGASGVVSYPQFGK